MNIFQSKYCFLGLIPLGFALAVVAGQSLEPDPGGANPLAIRESGFGMTLARLSQTAVNRAWHIGVEQVDSSSGHKSAGCDDPHCDHDHGHGHGHSHDHAHAHAHHDEENCATCSTEKARQKASGFLGELRRGKSARTNRYGLTDRHRLTASKNIENTLRKSYLLDPTNYGVYNDYYLFLTIHDLGSNEASRQRALEISRQTMSEALSEKENPEVFLTSAAAALNLFFTAQGRRKLEGGTLSREEVSRYGDFIADCLSSYEKIRRRRIVTGTWQLISPARRAEITERARFARKTHEQFSAMLERMPPENKGPWLARTGNTDKQANHQKDNE